MTSWLWNGTDPEQWATAPEGVPRALGIHPWPVARRGREWTETALQALERRQDLVAVGEIGLDFQHPERELQEWALRQQLELAARRELPVVLHSHRCHQRLLAILGEYPALTGMLHGFVGPPEPYQALGYRISLGRRSLEKLSKVPASGLLLETDTEPLTTLPEVYARAAERLGRPLAEIVRQTRAELQAMLANKKNFS